MSNPSQLLRWVESISPASCYLCIVDGIFYRLGFAGAFSNRQFLPLYLLLQYILQYQLDMTFCDKVDRLQYVRNQHRIIDTRNP